MLKRIHINQHIIRANAKTGKRNPVITVKGSGSNDYAHTVIINNHTKVVYSPDSHYPVAQRYGSKQLKKWN